MLGFKSFETAKKTTQGIETMHMINYTEELVIPMFPINDALNA
jgi:transposase-like protein